MKEIFHNPGHRYTKMLIDAVPQLGQGEGPKTAPAKAKPVLSVRNLVTRFDVKGGYFNRKVGRVHAVEGLNFDIAPGETLSFVGESGCGKSTTGRSILYLNPPDSGEVVFDGKNEVRQLIPSTEGVGK